MASCGFCLGV